MRKILLLALMLLALSNVAATAAFDPCHADDEKYIPVTERYKKGLVFKIRKCGLQDSYILGTMHSDDPKIVEMLAPAFSKLSYAKSAAFEIIADDASNKTALKSMYFPEGSVDTLQNMLGVELYTKLKTLLATIQPGMEEGTYYRMRPWAIAVMLQEPPNKSDGTALDFRLQSFAKQRGIPVSQLESAEEQMKVFDEVPTAQQVEFLRDAVDNYGQIAIDNQQMSDIYMKQDLNALQVLGDKTFDAITDRAFAEKLKIELVDKRNRKMVGRMKEYLDKGASFIAIGALHLTGEEGILKQLEEAGYYIDPVETDNGVGK